MPRERTFIMIKPDGVQRGLVSKIIERFEQKGFKLVAMKIMSASKELLEQHYDDLKSKPFFPPLIQYMNSGPVVPMVWEGEGVVKAGRVILGATRPSESAMGTVRGDFCIDVGRNICHGSDAVESANKEIALWFKPEVSFPSSLLAIQTIESMSLQELVDWASHSEPWVYEK